jgi:hypothetical protein
MKAVFKGRYRGADGAMHDESGRAEVVHRGGHSSVTAAGRGSGEVVWHGTSASGTFRHAGVDYRLTVRSAFTYTITDVDDAIVSEGIVMEEE